MIGYCCKGLHRGTYNGFSNSNTINDSIQGLLDLEMVASTRNVGIVSHFWFTVNIYTLIESNTLRYLIRQRSGCCPRRVRNHSNIGEHMRNQGKYYGLKWAFFYELAHSHRPFWKTTDWTILYNYWEKECICQSQGTSPPLQRLKILAEFRLLGANARY